MLDPTSPITLPDLDDVLVYADDSRADAFYAMPARPGVAISDDGTADMQLILYGRKEGSEFHVTGGMLTLTTSLGLTPNERASAIASLTAQLAAKAAAAAAAAKAAAAAAAKAARSAKPGGTTAAATGPAAATGETDPTGASTSDPPPPPPAQLLPIEWAEGKVTVTLPGNLTLSGQPSMMAENRCSLSTSLTAAQGTALSKAWKSSGDAGTITYTVKVRTRGVSRTTVGASFSVASDLGNAFVSQAGTATSGGGPLSLTLTGPLRASVPDLSARTSTITM